MNSITFIFSNEIQEIFDGSLNENLRFSKTISMNADDGILNNRWEIIGTKHMISLNNFVNNIIDLQKENKLEKIKKSEKCVKKTRKCCGFGSNNINQSYVSHFSIFSL